MARNSFREDVENLQNENAALRRSVESKCAAIRILRTELQNCQKERDQFKVLAETCNISQPTNMYTAMSSVSFGKVQSSPILSESHHTLAQLLSQAKEENKQLKKENSDFKCRLHDAQSDLRIFRAENTKKNGGHQNLSSSSQTLQLWKQERQSLVEKLEEITSQCQKYKADVRCLVEEREELIKEKEEAHKKLHRLNHMINVLLKSRNGSPSSFDNRTVDLDAIIGENRYLQQRIKQLNEEKKIALASSTKYKSALQCYSNKSNSVKLRSSTNLVVSSKQVSDLLEEYESLSQDGSHRDLKGLCLALSDALHQKTKVIKSQKSANKVLLERMMELEKRFFPNSGDETVKETAILAPLTALLMDGYRPSSHVASHELNDLDSSEASSSLSLASALNNHDFDGDADADAASTEVTRSQADEVNQPEGESEGTPRTSKDLGSVSEGTNYDLGKNPENSFDESEEIIPLEELDSYISKLKHQNCLRTKTAEENVALSLEQRNSLPLEEITSLPLEEITSLSQRSSLSLEQRNSRKNTDIPEPSFELDISDYDSDNDNLEQTLQNWQSEFRSHKSPRKIIGQLRNQKP